MTQSIARDQSVAQATIPSGAAVSNPIDYRDYASGGLVMPAGWTSAAIAFKVSADKVSFIPLKVAAGTLLELATPAANEARPLPAELAAFAFFQLWSETSGSDVAQGADRAFTLHLKA